MLPPVFTILRKHSRTSVRVATVHAAAALLGGCSNALPGCATIWLECLLAMAQDPWPQVSSAAAAALHKLQLYEDDCACTGAASDDDECIRLSWTALRATLLQHLHRFGGDGGESDAVATARLLTGAVYLAGPARVVDAVHHSPSERRTACTNLLRVFRVSPAGRISNASHQVGLVQTLACSGAADIGSRLPRHPQLATLTSDEARRERSEDGRARAWAAAPFNQEP